MGYLRGQDPKDSVPEYEIRGDCGSPNCGLRTAELWTCGPATCTSHAPIPMTVAKPRQFPRRLVALNIKAHRLNTASVA